MDEIKRGFRERALLFAAAILLLLSWSKLEYRRFALVDLSVNKKEALLWAERYLGSLGYDLAGYSRSIIFHTEYLADTFFQKTIGPQKEEAFFKQHNFELFYWNVRFFKQFQKQEFLVRVSPKTGEVLAFTHLIDETEKRPDFGKEGAFKKAEEFLKDNHALDLGEYEFHEEKSRRYENRTDYSFSWKKRGVSIPWQPDKGAGKLLIGLTVSGIEVLDFYRNRLDLPENFSRFLQRQTISGEYFFSVYYFLFLLLLFYAVYILLRKRNSFAIVIPRKRLFYWGIALALLNFLAVFNNLSDIIMSYPTSTGLASYIGISLIRSIVNLFVLLTFFVLPAAAGEYLRRESLPEYKYCSFLHYLKSTFCARSLSRSILLGYLIFLIILGLQAQIFYLGQKFLGVWREWYRLNQFSSAFCPFYNIFVVALSAAFFEEMCFRVFGISLTKKFLKNTFFSVALISLLWGLGHSGYMIFPFWFRIIEVTILGMVLGFAFLRYGVIAVITAHYLLDVFLMSAPYLLGRSSIPAFLTALFLCFIPLLISIVIYCINKEEKEREIDSFLTAGQKYNLEILTAFIAKEYSSGKSRQSLRQELTSQGWDIDLLDLALNKKS